MTEVGNETETAATEVDHDVLGHFSIMDPEAVRNRGNVTASQYLVAFWSPGYDRKAASPQG